MSFVFVAAVFIVKIVNAVVSFATGRKWEETTVIFSPSRRKAQQLTRGAGSVGISKPTEYLIVVSSPVERLVKVNHSHDAGLGFSR
jgi:hypothetical protein